MELNHRTSDFQSDAHSFSATEANILRVVRRGSNSHKRRHRARHYPVVIQTNLKILGGRDWIRTSKSVGFEPTGCTNLPKPLAHYQTGVLLPGLSYCRYDERQARFERATSPTLLYFNSGRPGEIRTLKSTGSKPVRCTVSISHQPIVSPIFLCRHGCLSVQTP